MSTAPVRIANASGFYGDRFSAMREVLEGGPLDFVTGDYLAELTMLILGRDRLRDPTSGFAKTFLRQMESCLGLALDKRVRVVVNAGGLNPAGLADAIRALAARLGLTAKVAHVEGDDLISRAEELALGTPLTANAYLGAWGIASCIRAGADVVVTGRVTDASLVVGAAAAHFGWASTDWNRLAGATVAGHVLECGPQACGGNFSLFTELDLRRPIGFPIAEIDTAGSSVITKHPGTGGAVTVDTVIAQLMYEIAGPRYAGPDVTSRFDTVRVTSEGPDRVRIAEVQGEPPPPTLKVCLNHLGGYRNGGGFILTGLDIEKKAALVKEQLEAALALRPREVLWTLVRSDREDAESEELASAILRVAVKDPDPKVVGRSFSAALVELALSSYPGFAPTGVPGDASPFGVCTAAYVDAQRVVEVAVHHDGTRTLVAPGVDRRALEEVDAPALPAPLAVGPTRRVPLGRVALARSGDKGGNANVGVWVRRDDQWRWLAHTLTVERLRQLLPEAALLPVARHLLPNVRGLNFVIEGLLGEGVAASARFDPQAKGLGEWLRSRHLDIPESFLGEGPAD